MMRALGVLYGNLGCIHPIDVKCRNIRMMKRMKMVALPGMIDYGRG